MAPPEIDLAAPLFFPQIVDTFLRETYLTHLIQFRPKTRHAILKAAFDVFSRDGSASLSDVAAAAGVGRATLHRHFAGSADLFAALTETAMRELDEGVARAVAPATSWTASLRLSLEAIIPLANRQLFLEKEPAGDSICIQSGCSTPCPPDRRGWG